MAEFSSWISFGSNTSSKFEEAIAKLGALHERIPSAAKQAIHDELDELTKQAKAKLMSEPVHGLKQTGLRARIAAGIEVVPTDGGHRAQVTVDDNEILPIPWGLDVASKGWKHPVFGRKDSLVHQQGTVPWWSETMAQAQPDLEEKLPEKIDEAIRETFGE